MLDVTYVEINQESRSFQVSRDSISQDFVYAFCGNFVDEASDSPDAFFGLDDDHQVLKALYQYIPWFREFMLPDGLMYMLYINSVSGKQINDEVWEITLNYDVPKDGQSTGGSGGGGGIDGPNELGPSAGEPDNSNEFTQLSFNSEAKSEHIVESRRLLAISQNDNAPNDVPTLYEVGKPMPIGLLSDGTLKGYDIYKRDFTFQITQYFPPTRLKYKYVRRIYRMTGTVNNSSFFGFATGSVLFLGATASGDLFANVAVTFSFAVAPNFSFIQAADSILADPLISPIGNPDKIGDPDFPLDATEYWGWDVVEYLFAEIPDSASGMVLQRPDYRLIHRVYESTDFDVFDL
jgi:hypothetical protein